MCVVHDAKTGKTVGDGRVHKNAMITSHITSLIYDLCQKVRLRDGTTLWFESA